MWQEVPSQEEQGETLIYRQNILVVSYFINNVLDGSHSWVAKLSDGHQKEKNWFLQGCAWRGEEAEQEHQRKHFHSLSDRFINYHSIINL